MKKAKRYSLQLTKKDLAQIEAKASNGAHREMMEASGIKSGAHKNKKAYNRKEKHRKSFA